MARVVLNKPHVAETINTATENARFNAFSGLAVNKSNAAVGAIEYRHLAGRVQVIGHDTMRYSGAGTQTILNFGNMYPGAHPYDGRQPITQTLKMFATPWNALEGDLLRVIMDIEIIEYTGTPFIPYSGLYSGANFVWAAQPYIFVGGVLTPIGADHPHGASIGSGGGPVFTTIYALDHTLPICQATYDCNIVAGSEDTQSTTKDRFQFSRDYVLKDDVVIQGFQAMGSGPYRIRWNTANVDIEPWDGSEDMLLGKMAMSMILLRK